ncbi:TrkH family potassium uptake protein [Anoxybacillus flavithermus]|uniref:TrkH family potassium uptake protein n=1 Tax=Anoxybacillus flavithermus TaxID=33934 RepID=UPI00054D4016|nr:TrkH family potassium uptake protein [Anoxybacillus flavithermus]MBE2926179.1 Ktr system potassium transporter B [Anoxybacillus flavithermus]MBE2937101.1 Ktr system potassium transporter B [Anoxybacillus flavithermus]MBE2944803.1 Ktr system potassium transporter B [Anoxybacillus flavithermus]MBE2947650.1 Ktr system potassium transporter B [Anoxybacillus flavithermus]
MTKPLKLNPPQLLAIMFLFLVVVGGVLLKLPIATEKDISWLDAFFLSTSAATVTGLAPIDPGSTFTLFGEIVLMVLIQVGGLGIMTFAVLVVIVLGKKIGMKQRMLMQEALNQPSLGGVIRLARNLLLFSLFMECIGVILLAIDWVPKMGWAKGLYYSLFHTIAAFNNAGFALWPDNLSRFVGDPIVNVTITLLIIVGGLGFTVVFDVLYQRRWRKLSLHTKLMLVMTLIVNVLAIVAIFLFEHNNPKTLGSLPFREQLWAAYFQGITPRTAGFNTIDIGSLEQPTAMLMIFLMFVGAGSTSTGGGIKLTTFAVIVFAVVSFLKGKEETVIWQRTIRHTIILRALAIASMSMLFIFLVTMILTLTEDAPFLVLLFEVVSAFGTVGLSMNMTPHLSAVGKMLIIGVMLFGKLGPLTLVYSIAKPKKTNIRYPNGDILTG